MLIILQPEKLRNTTRGSSAPLPANTIYMSETNQRFTSNCPRFGVLQLAIAHDKLRKLGTRILLKNSASASKMNSFRKL